MTDGSLAPQNLTQLLVKWRNGDRGALDEMTPVLYEELRKLARHFLASERSDHTLQPTALVHEAYLRLIDQHAVDWRNRAHFLAMAATMMRRILINHAEAHRAAKREGSVEMVGLDEAFGLHTDPRVDLLHFSGPHFELHHVENGRAPDHLNAVASHVRFGFDQELGFFPFAGADNEIARQRRTPSDHPEEPAFGGLLKRELGHGIDYEPCSRARKPENWSCSNWPMP